ncbi:MAG: PAS domain-containing protein [Anaerolineales bacterium]|nr:PAS domain-containing protein [Anaerolineales bacterium]
MAEHERSSADPLANRLEFETLISDLSSRFINVPPSEVDHEIEDALRRVCELLGIDLAVLWQWSGAAPGVITPTHAYTQEGLQPPGQLRQEQFPWYVEEMLAGRMVAVSSLEELPAEAAVDRETCHLIGVKSNLCLPLSVGGEPPVGALGLNTLRVQHQWPDALVKRLQLVAQVFTNALARRRHELSLQESEERLSLAADSAEAGLWVLDYSTGVFWATERARAIFGYSPDEVVSMERFEASVHPDDWDLVRGAIERSMRAGEPVNVEYRILPGGGRVRWISSRGRPRTNSTGEPERLMGVSIDITERKRAEEAFHTSEARLAAGADLAGLAFYEVDFGDRTVFVDDRFRDVCGVPPDRDQGLQPLEFWIEHLHPDDRQRVMEQRRQLHDGRLERLIIDYRYLHPTHGEKWLHHVARVARRDATGRAVVTFGVLRDITERKRAEETLRDLSRRLIRAHEEERALLARELHDDLTQRVAVLAIEVGRAELAAPEGSQAQAMGSVREGLVRLSEDIHSLAYQLHPSVLEELGLAEALRAECERLGRQGRLDLSVELDPLPAFVGRDAALCLFRVAQEALNNVTRHAGARAASVALRQMNGGLLLAVRDDGVGFDPASPQMRRSLGLASMRERVLLVNGTLDIESAPGRGTEIVAWVPVEGAR